MNSVTLLDGGMGRELEQLGAPFKQPEWSALALMEGPEWVSQAHQAFVSAGAEIITSNAYAVVPYHIGEKRFVEGGFDLARLAAQLARDVAASSGGVKVAGCLPPLFGSYEPQLFDSERAGAMYKVLIEAQQPFVDFWLGETISSLAEFRSYMDATEGSGLTRWASFSISDELCNGQAELRSGETIAELVSEVAGHTALDAVLFNCSQPEIIGQALKELSQAEVSFRYGAYANTFPAQCDAAANEVTSELRDDLTPERYREFAQDWINTGATIIGGCCGIGPAHIRALRQLCDENG